MTHNITLQEAVVMTQRYRENKVTILVPSFQPQNILPLCETFDRTAVDHLLAQSGCVALRVYYGMDIELKIHALLVGVNAANADILPAAAINEGVEDEGDIVEQAIRCPPTCPPASPLNEP